MIANQFPAVSQLVFNAVVLQQLGVRFCFLKRCASSLCNIISSFETRKVQEPELEAVDPWPSL